MQAHPTQQVSKCEEIAVLVAVIEVATQKRLPTRSDCCLPVIGDAVVHCLCDRIVCHYCTTIMTCTIILAPSVVGGHDKSNTIGCRSQTTDGETMVGSTGPCTNTTALHATMLHLSIPHRYTEALALVPVTDINTQRILLSNRSAAGLQANRCQDALVDADGVIVLAPKWDKGYWRRAKALAALRRCVDKTNIDATGI